jgi:hypothetical protein
LPTGGSCRAAVVYKIDKGHYGDVSLDGLRVAAVYAWPKAIHDGDGQMQLIVDESAGRGAMPRDRNHHDRR